MQGLAWDDLRHLLAAHRAGSFAGAARHLGVDDTTVSRRLRALERAAGRALIRRGVDGRVSLTATGEAVVAHAERMEREARAIGRALGAPGERALGTVRMTAVPIVAHRALLPALPPLLAAHPGLVVELVPERRDLSLTRREADLAVRLARPIAGGSRVRARRVGTLAYGAFAAAGLSDEAALAAGWITHEEATAHLPPAWWLARAAARGKAAGLRVSDAETALEAAAWGLGMALLPAAAGRGDPRLRPLPLPDLPPPPGREVWLLSHVEPADPEGVGLVAEWIASLLS